MKVNIENIVLPKHIQNNIKCWGKYICKKNVYFNDSIYYMCNHYCLLNLDNVAIYLSISVLP